MEQTLEKILQAAQGLYMLSETDAPFEPLDLGQQPSEGFNGERLLSLLSKPADSPVEEQELSYFLRNMTKVWEGASAEKQAEIERFRQLQGLLLATLTMVKVYRIGQTQIEAYLLGWTPDNLLIGLKTLQVET
ncbi:nuclease A inhibitor family protein [Rufibacter aurantiacus]|uniref:nuclease A inhibitor family protein n=1 Tax=Rufibacter aurantiacus TaxID=2817374 RepID=UPI001B3139E2|nr:nuclease A inhibitor family protein [Rufibacter aurantiacus]